MYAFSYHLAFETSGGEPPFLFENTFQFVCEFVSTFHLLTTEEHLSAKPPLAQPRSASLA